MKNRTAHDHWFVAGLQQRHRDQFDPIRFDRHELVNVNFGTCIRDTKHDGNVRAINVHVHHANACAIQRKGDCKVNSDGRLSNAALAGGDSNDVPYAFDGELVADASAFRNFRIHCDRDGSDAGQGAY